MPVVFTGQKRKRIRLETFFAPHQPGAGAMPSIASYGYQFKKACLSADLVDLDGNAKYTPRSLRHFFASTALANGVPIHEVSRWLGHRSVKTTVDIYGHLLPSAWDCCREVLHRAMRPASPGPMSLPAEEDSRSAGDRAA